ncbi:transcriptional regulator, AraC family [Marinobacter sp. LV10R510-11A]|uniref:helix-turn-helix transcriptional regulator n=1 Tax=Marinobacter sp. LV10R510-11A TaxID=1415568 RepID=UPI000BB9B972|nr:AraC family transcriptional regulator [Marinobacter sp. LV10R510-11A]SOB76206.1 transcriptional regulator, AraC family [Marinobacter sp. LV10R510-11A]
MGDSEYLPYLAGSSVDQPTNSPAHYVVGPYIQPVLLAYLYAGGRLSTLADAMAVSDLWIINPPEKIAIEEYFRLVLSASHLLQDAHLGIKIGQHAGLVCESVLAGIIHLAEQLTGRLIPMMEVCFVHPRPSDYRALEYQQGFRAQCKFSQSYNSIMIAADVLSWPLQHIARPSVTAMDSRHVVEQVKNELKRSLTNSPKLAQIASILGQSERGLQRQLKQHGTSYQHLLAEVRLGHAQDYLKYSNLSILQISQLLGFKEQSSFNHFFLQEAGASPKKWQETKKHS